MSQLSTAGGVFALSLWLASPVGAQDRPLDASRGQPAVADPVICGAVSGRLPPSVALQKDLVPRVQIMLHRSPTFREQCLRLAAVPWMHVAVRTEPDFSDRRRFRAASVIQRPQPRLFVAVVTLQALADPAMWLAHEFEHLIEQLDDVDLKGRAFGRWTVWVSSDGMVETARAIRAGQVVFDEVIESADDHIFVD